MDTATYLRSRGWKGTGHSLNNGATSLAKPILVSSKRDQLGVGKQKASQRVSDQWWMRAFDTSLAGLDVSNKNEDGSGTITVTQTAGSTNILQSVSMSKAGKWGGLYGAFKLGEGLEGTMNKLSLTKSTIEGSTSAANAGDGSVRSRKSKKRKLDETGDPGDEKRKRKEMKERKRKSKQDSASGSDTAVETFVESQSVILKLKEKKDKKDKKKRNKVDILDTDSTRSLIRKPRVSDNVSIEDDGNSQGPQTLTATTIRDTSKRDKSQKKIKEDGGADSQLLLIIPNDSPVLDQISMKEKALSETERLARRKEKAERKDLRLRKKEAKAALKKDS
jgi:nucleolar protein TMA23